MPDIVQPFTTTTLSLPRVAAGRRDTGVRCPICGGLNYVCATA